MLQRRNISHSLTSTKSFENVHCVKQIIMGSWTLNISKANNLILMQDKKL